MSITFYDLPAEIQNNIYTRKFSMEFEEKFKKIINELLTNFLEVYRLECKCASNIIDRMYALVNDELEGFDDTIVEIQAENEMIKNELKKKYKNYPLINKRLERTYQTHAIGPDDLNIVYSRNLQNLKFITKKELYKLCETNQLNILYDNYSKIDMIKELLKL